MFANDLRSTAADYAAFGEAFAAALNDKDQSALSELFAVAEFTRAIADDLFDDDEAKRDFLRGFRGDSQAAFVSILFHSWFSQELSAKYLRTMDRNRPVVRVNFVNGGLEYILISMREVAGELVAVDLYLMTAGRTLSASAGLASQIMLKPSNALLTRLFGEDYRANQPMAAKFRLIGELRREGDLQGAYDLIQSLPDSVRDNRLMVDTAVQLTSHLDETEYRKQLTRLGTLYGDDESAGLTLINYYLTTGDYDKAESTINRLVRFLGEDAALANIQAVVAMDAKKYELAEQYGLRAIELEPDFEDAYWTLVTIALEQRNFDGVTVGLQRLEKVFNYEFTPDGFDPEVFGQYTQSESMKKWLQ
ncbi:MAG: hypothetical protein AAGH76_10600 [Pseudomonadota bacterium]